jgi:hypothetical protein
MLSRASAIVLALGMLVLLHVLPGTALAQSPPTVTLNVYYGSAHVLDSEDNPFVCTTNNKPSSVDAVELTTHISLDLANQIALTYFDPRMAASTTYRNIFYWALLTDEQLLNNPEHRNANNDLYVDLRHKLPCSCATFAEFDTGPQYVETDRYFLNVPGQPGAMAVVNFFERDDSRICTSR